MDYKFALISISNFVLKGNTYEELLQRFTEFSIDYNFRKLILYGKYDTISYSKEYTDEEFKKEIYKRCIELMIRDYGWTLYQKV